MMSALGFQNRMDPLACALHHLSIMDSSYSPLSATPTNHLVVTMVGLSISHYFSRRGMRPAQGFHDWPLAYSLDSQPNELPRLTLSVKPLELLLKSQGGISNVIFALDLRKRTLTILRTPCSTSLCWGLKCQGWGGGRV